jgi:hypothetical protein
MLGVTREYRSSVMLIVECPSISDATFGWMPDREEATLRCGAGRGTAL